MILDADIKGFFDNLNHDWIIKFISSRITDPNILRLVGRMLKAGIFKDGRFYVDDFGAGQGSVCSLIIVNIYMHYVLFTSCVEPSCEFLTEKLLCLSPFGSIK